ncbi:MAG: FkbM family methyltransferase [Bacteroidota bacterium]|nr:FkbM family methyltransferase [Bacteroidota bacterium]
MKRFINSYKNINNWWGFWKFYYSRKPSTTSFKAKLNRGLEVEIPKDLISAFDEVFLREVYKSENITLNAKPVIFDIGANVGYFSLYMYASFPLAQIIAFEPVPSNFILLAHHKEKNNLDNLKLDKRAVVGDSNSANISYNSNVNFSVGASILERNSSDKTITVEALTIPNIFKEYKIDHCDLLKVDCEGAEYNIIYNCPSTYFNKISNIVIEVHKWVPENIGTIKELISFLEGENFKVMNNKNEILMCWKN